MIAGTTPGNGLRRTAAAVQTLLPPHRASYPTCLAP
jgi:hypothetical protein